MTSEAATGVVDHEDMAAAIRSRRTINLFEPEPVGTAVLHEAIEIARWAPNHRLTEPWRFYLLGTRTAEQMAELAGRIDAQAKGERAGEARRQRMLAIPGNFVVTSPLSDDALLEREDYAACCCAVQNLMLYLWQRGVGVKWTTGAITREQGFYDLLGIDSSAERIVGLFWYGTPKVVPTQKRKKGPEELVFELD